MVQQLPFLRGRAGDEGMLQSQQFKTFAKKTYVALNQGQNSVQSLAAGR